MDGANFPLDNLDATIDDHINDIIVHATDDQMNEMLEILDQLYGCECGCEGRRHPRLARQVLHELGQLRMRINF